MNHRCWDTGVTAQHRTRTHRQSRHRTRTHRQPRHRTRTHTQPRQNTVPRFHVRRVLSRLKQRVCLERSTEVLGDKTKTEEKHPKRPPDRSTQEVVSWGVSGRASCGGACCLHPAAAASLARVRFHDKGGIRRIWCKAERQCVWLLDKGRPRKRTPPSALPCPRGSGTGGEPLSPGAPAGQLAGNEGREEKATGPASVGGEDQSPGDMNGQPRGRVCWLQVAPGERGCS